MNRLGESVFLESLRVNRGTAPERLGARREDVFELRFRGLDLPFHQHFRDAHVLRLPDGLVLAGLRPGRGGHLLASLHCRGCSNESFGFGVEQYKCIIGRTAAPQCNVRQQLRRATRDAEFGLYPCNLRLLLSRAARWSCYGLLRTPFHKDRLRVSHYRFQIIAKNLYSSHIF